MNHARQILLYADFSAGVTDNRRETLFVLSSKSVTPVPRDMASLEVIERDKITCKPFFLKE